ncbi:MAG TPA: calcium-binding protein [Crinalium sp.]|jgi:Ca2+-binding RTX toxin-like protein
MVRLRGGNRRDVFLGAPGKDVYFGGGGNDLLRGGAGNDKCFGDEGNDLVDGGLGDDTVKGGAGNDRLFGGAGDDTIDGGAGNDIIRGGAGDDSIKGGSGKDTIYGDSGDDNLDGGSGNDILYGGRGNDFVSGGTGDDRMRGGSGDDTLDWDDGEGNDVISGDSGRDTVEVNGSLAKGDNFVLSKLSPGRTLFERVGLDGQPVGLFNLKVDTAEVYDVFGEGGNDSFVVKDLSGTGVDVVQFTGGAGDDTLDATATFTRIVADGGEGSDTLDGGTADDTLSGGDGNDFLSAKKGNDIMNGGNGDDRMDWDDGEGNDIISGGAGRDTVEVNGSVLKGDNFVLGKNADSKAFFERVGLDGQPVGQFNLVVDTSEVFDVFGEGGNDSFIVNDLTGTGVDLVQFTGGAGNDILDARATSTRVIADGGDGNDILIGGTGTIVGANGAVTGDVLTGGAGKDTFQFSTDPFAGATPGQNLNRPDVITDYTIGGDVLAFSSQQTGINTVKFQKGNSAQLSGDSNVLVLTNGFANAGAAAAAIRDNNNITAGKGLFVYFNTTLGFSRVVVSQDLANGGPFSVQANLINQTNVNNQGSFSSADFTLVS